MFLLLERGMTKTENHNNFKMTSIFNVLKLSKTWNHNMDQHRTTSLKLVFSPDVTKFLSSTKVFHTQGHKASFINHHLHFV